MSETPQITTALAVQEQNAPMTIKMEMSIDEAKKHLARLRAFVSEVLKEGTDYGIIPGTDKKTLYKPGAEGLCEIYALTIEQDQIRAIERWDDDDPFFAYDYKTTLTSRRTGQKVAEGIGHANSREGKWRWRWVFEDQVPAGRDKASLHKEQRKSKKTGKSFTMYRIPNDDLFSVVNTIQKMAAKRSLVDATLKATRSSGVLTQDLEDLRANGVILDEEEYLEAEYTVKNDEPPTPGQAPSHSEPKGNPITQKQMNFLYGLADKKGVTKDELQVWVRQKMGCAIGELRYWKDGDKWAGSYSELCDQIRDMDAQLFRDSVRAALSRAGLVGGDVADIDIGDDPDEHMLDIE